MLIEQKRKERNMTQQELADAIGTRQNNISRYERSERTPDLRTLKALAKVFGCSIDELLQDPEEEAAAAA